MSTALSGPSIRACSEYGLLVAQATRLCRPATRRTEREREFEPMGMVFSPWRRLQFRSAGRRPWRAGHPRHPFSKQALTGFARDNKRIEHQVAQRGGVEQKIDWPGHVTIGAQNLLDIAAVVAQEKFNLHSVRGNDGVVIRLEGCLHDRRHSL